MILIVGGIFFIFAGIMLGQRIEKKIDGKENIISYNGRNYVYNDDFINILCLGIDNEEELGMRNSYNYSVGQADAIFLASFNTDSGELYITAIPRDTIVKLKKFHLDGSEDGTEEGQITLQYAYSDGKEKSCELMREQVSGLLDGLPIHAYAAINLSAIPVINDAVGGVTVTMDDDYTYLNPEFVKGASIHLMGETALDYVHRRDTSVHGSALDRINRLVTYMKAFMPQAQQALKHDALLPFTVLDELQGNIVTDLDTKTVTLLAAELPGCTLADQGIYTLEGSLDTSGEYEKYYIDTDAVTAYVVDIFYR